MTRGQLPKAYLRIDPNIDQTHPDNLDGFIRLLCAANRQPVRGRFRHRAVLDALFGKAGTDRLIARRDVVADGDGTLDVPGWEPWQEGDHTVPERMRRVRQRRNTTVTETSPDPASNVTEPSPERSSTHKAARQQGSKAVDVLSDALPREPDFDVDLWGRVMRLAEELTGVPHGLRSPYSGIGAQALSQASDVPWPSLEGAWRKVAAVYGRPTVRQLVFDSEDHLRPTGKAKPAPVSEEDRKRAEARRALRLDP